MRSEIGVAGGVDVCSSIIVLFCVGIVAFDSSTYSLDFHAFGGVDG